MLKKYNKIWNRTKDLFGKEFNSEPVSKYKYIRAKIKSQFTNSQDNEIKREEKNSALLFMTFLESIVCMNKGYYPKIL